MPEMPDDTPAPYWVPVMAPMAAALV